MRSVDPYALIGIDLADFINRPAWMADGLCNLYPDVSWFPERGQDAAAAKAVCARCPVSAQCLAYALEHEERGIWAGTSERKRKQIGRAAA